MQCKVEGCERAPHYKAACLCQMHYFRQWRYGTTETLRKGKRQPRVVMPGAGYIRVHAPGHPLADKSGMVSEHRKVVFDDLGPGPMSCELCGVGVTWETVHIDHIDETVSNNDRSNLRPTCNACNTQRGRAPEHTYSSLPITFEGVTLTAHEWSRDPRVKICGGSIRRRLRAGQSVEQALFGEKKTHNGKPCKKTDKRRALESTYRAKAKELEKA